MGLFAIIIILLFVFYPAKMKAIIVRWVELAEEKYKSGEGLSKLDYVYEKFAAKWGIIDFILPLPLIYTIIEKCLEIAKERWAENPVIAERLENGSETNEAA
jgi:hypothetical protein